MPEDSLPQVGAPDPDKQTSPISDAEDAGETADAVEAKAAVCWFNGRQYSYGAEVCSNGQRLRCTANGVWQRYGRC